MLPRLVSRTTDSGAGMTVTEKVQRSLEIRAHASDPRGSLRANTKMFKVHILDAPIYQRAGLSRNNVYGAEILSSLKFYACQIKIT